MEKENINDRVDQNKRDIQGIEKMIKCMERVNFYLKRNAIMENLKMIK